MSVVRDLDKAVEILFGPGWYAKESFLTTNNKSVGSLDAITTVPAGTEKILNSFPIATTEGALITDMYLWNVDNVGSEYLRWFLAIDGIKQWPYYGLAIRADFPTVRCEMKVPGGRTAQLGVVNLTGTAPEFGPPLDIRLVAGMVGNFVERQRDKR